MRHFRDLPTESYVKDCAQIAASYYWASKTAFTADWDTMGMAWVVRNSLWNASCASPQRQPLVGSWADRTLEVSSIDMSFLHLQLQLHPFIPRSCGRLMMLVAIWHVS